MLILAVLLSATLLARIAGLMGWDAFDSWPSATRAGLAVMLFFTASAHFTAMREDLIRMVPAWMPRPRAVVFITGVCEILGGIGLLLPPSRRAAALALVVFFFAVFPANVRAVREGISLGGRPATPLWLRVPMQLLFIGLTAWAGWISVE